MNRANAHGCNAPYFLAIRHGAGFETRGQATAQFGHQLPSSHHDTPDGVFARWHWDGTRLVARNDRYGFYPLFWHQRPDGGLGISPSLVCLIEHGAPTGLDIDALAVFFRLGYFIGNDTPFAAIKVLPPDAVFEWTDGKLECRARPRRVPEVASISRDDAIERYIELFAAAMAKRAPRTASFAVPVSGGRDSRHILLELHRMGLRPAACVTARDHPPDPNQDPEIAKLLCARLGFDCVVLEQSLSLMAAHERKNRETHFCATAHGWYLALADFLNHRFDGVYDGIAGDVLSQSLNLNPRLDALFRSRDTGAISDELLSHYASGFAVRGGGLKRKFESALDRAVAKERLAREVAKHVDMPNPIASFMFWNRTRRQIALAPHGLLAGIPCVYAPYLDHDLFDFMVTLPAGMLMDRRFHTDAIARAYPAYADIPYADHKHAPPADDRAVRARFLAEAAYRFLLRKPSSLGRNIGERARMLGGVLSGGRITSWALPWLIYMDQLESLIEDQHRHA